MSDMKLLIIACVTAATLTSQCPAEGVDGDSRKLARQVLIGQRDSRERLVSGTFRAKGTARQVRHALPKIEFETDVSFFSAFDYGRKQLRIDHEQMQRMGTGDLLPMGGKFARTPEQALIFSAMSRERTFKRIGIRPPNWLPRSRFVGFDVRTVGAVNYYEFQQGLRFDVTPERLFDPERGLLTEEKLAEAVAESDRVTRVSWIFGDNDFSNEAIPERLFTIEGFDVPNPLVVDHRLGDKPIIIRHPTIKDPKKLRKIQGLPPER